MAIRLVSLIISCLFFADLKAQILESKPYYPYPAPFYKPYHSKTDSSDYVKPIMMQPTLGFGSGVLTFFGDIRDNSTFSQSLSRIGYNFSISEFVSRSFVVGARVMFGTLGANESGSRFANFESSIRLGGLYVSYNFDKYLPRKRRIDPFVTTGIEYFEYLSKTDLFDAAGNQYFLWSNGIFMSLPENDPNASIAIPINRDYSYETDIRTHNKSLFRKYSEHSFAIPAGIGVTMHLAQRWNFKLGVTYHFTFTNYIDGITSTNQANGRGNNKPDKFLESYFTLTFDIFKQKSSSQIPPLTDEDYDALDNEDSDGDGVTDFNDSCQGTPSGIAVDPYGCPIDSDGDGKSDFADKEPYSPTGALVDENGVSLDDSTIAIRWREWSDTSYAYVKYEKVINPTIVASANWGIAKRKETIVYKRELTVLLGAYKSSVPPSDMGKLLNVPDIRSSLQPDSTTAYVSGVFTSKDDAEKYQSELIAAGFPNAKIMLKNKNGSLSDPTSQILSELSSTKSNGSPSIDTKGVLYRVQLGAYSKKLSPSVFKNAGPVIILKTENGLYKYVSGSYSTIQDALKQKDELINKGYNGAFVVAYKDNSRVSLTSNSGGIIQKTENLEDPKSQESAINKKLISFKVQVGVFTNEPPADILNKLSQVPNLERRKRASGATQYVAGKFNSYEEAQKFRDEIITKYGISDAFIVAYFKNEIIPIPEALELLK